MSIVEMNKQMKLTEHLASPSVASLSHSNELDGLRLSPHFTLGEMTKTSYKTKDGNIPSHVAIENLRAYIKTVSYMLIPNPAMIQRPGCSTRP